MLSIPLSARNTKSGYKSRDISDSLMDQSTDSYIIYWVTQKIPQIYTAYHATFPKQIRKITVQVCGNFWVNQ